ncbi:MAG: putative toxin-antitoxin system toxin component, PIN family [Gammaproteobacteria bacterium]
MSAVIIDTNVIVAGLLTARNDSPVARILDGMLAAAFPFVVSEALLAEYRAVLDRPVLRKVHALSMGEVETLVVSLAEHAIVLVPAPAAPAPDPGDQHLWDLLAAQADLRLVTGDKRLFEQNANSRRVITPRAFHESCSH